MFVITRFYAAQKQNVVQLQYNEFMHCTVKSETLPFLNEVYDNVINILTKWNNSLTARWRVMLGYKYNIPHFRAI